MTTTLFAGSEQFVFADECESSPCRNGATCIDELDYYTCECMPRFTGTRCEAGE